MRENEVITLVAEVKTVNEIGDTVVIPQYRQVMAELKSITRSEFYQAQTAGLKPEIKFVIADYLDYHGEQKILYTPYYGVQQEYSVIRTYRDGMRLEIVCKRGVDV